MDNFYLNEVVAEITPLITGRRLTRVALNESDLLLEFGGPRHMLVARLASDNPALYLASQKASARGSEGEDGTAWSGSGQQMVLQLRSKLVGAGVTAIEKDPGDRVVTISFTQPGLSEVLESRFKLVLIFAGRSVNALLVGENPLLNYLDPLAATSVSGETGSHSGPVVLAALKEAGPIRAGSSPPRPRALSFDPARALNDLENDLSSDEILDSYFGRSSPFNKKFQQEFLSRCKSQPPSLAFRSILEDLFKRDRKPLIYASAPIGGSFAHLKPRQGEICRSAAEGRALSERPSDKAAAEQVPAAEILLSSVELTVAEGMYRYDFASFSEAAEVYSQATDKIKALRIRQRRLTAG